MELTRLVALIATTAALLWLVPGAHASSIVIQAESMSWPAGSGAVDGDGYALSRDAWSGAYTVGVAQSLTGVAVRARSEQSGLACTGSPQLGVEIDGMRRITATVTPGTAYAQRQFDVGPRFANFSVGPGSHTIRVGLLAGQSSDLLGCTRRVWIDKVTLVASSLFSPSSYRNRRLADNAPLDPDQSYAAKLLNQARTFGTWVGATQWTAPIYIVPAGQAEVDVVYDTRFANHLSTAPYFNADGRGVPLPGDAKSAAPVDDLGDGDALDRRPHNPGWSDRELVLYQPASDRAWDFYHLLRYDGAWKATQIGRISGLSDNFGSFDPWPDGSPHGVTAARIPELATLQTLDELRAGAINHVVDITIPHASLSTADQPNFRAPAGWSDGDSIDWDAIPEGTMFRLPASLDIDALGLSPYAAMVARAVQRYGLVVNNKDCWTSKLAPGATCEHSPVGFSAEEPRPYPDATHPDPYQDIFDGKSQDQFGVLKNFPWDRLQVLPPVSATP